MLGKYITMNFVFVIIIIISAYLYYALVYLWFSLWMCVCARACVWHCVCACVFVRSDIILSVSPPLCMSLSICLSVSFVQCLLVFTCLFLKDLLHQLFPRARPQSTSLPYPLRSCIYRVVCFIPNYVAITQFASSSKLPLNFLSSFLPYLC